MTSWDDMIWNNKTMIWRSYGVDLGQGHGSRSRIKGRDTIREELTKELQVAK